jgi:hypothetical protein
MPSQARGIEEMKEGRRVSEARVFSSAGRFTRMAWVVVFLMSWLAAGRAAANSAPLPVSFEGGGQALPQAEIRVAIATELGRETLADDAAAAEMAASRERVVVAVDELGQLWVRYWGPRGLVDRHLAMPARPDQIRLVVSLSVGNLVRQEAFDLLRDIERRRAEQDRATAGAGEPAAKAVESSPKPAATTAIPRPAPQRRAAAPASPPRVTPNSSWGHYLVGDFPYFPAVERACSASGGDSCYDRNFEPISYDVEGAGVAGGIVAAHSRYVMAYSRALRPDLRGSVRVGFAFSGGEAKSAAGRHDDDDMSKFMPWLFEARLQHFPSRGAFGGALRPFVHVAAGVSDVSAEVKLQVPMDGTGQTPASLSGRGPITQVHPLGLLFAGAGFGGSLQLFDPLRLEAELSLFGTFPAAGWLARPSVGLSYDF